MTRTFLIATVAALAITAPAQAQRPDREDKKEQRAQKAERAQPQRAERQRPARVERQAPKRVERPQPKRVVERQAPKRVAQQAPKRIERQAPQRVARQAPQRVERPQPKRIERQVPQRIARQAPQRVERAQPKRIERQAAQRVERPQPKRVERQRIERQPAQSAQRVQPQRVQRQRIEQSLIQNRPAQRVATQQQLQAQRIARVQDRIEDRNQRFEIRAQQRVVKLPSRTVGERIDLRQVKRDRFDRFAAQRYARSAGTSSKSIYDYDSSDGYLYQINPQTSVVTALYPLLGGAISPGLPMPVGTGSTNVPYAYQSLYYDTPSYNYRYGDGAVYRVDQGTQVIQAIVALLTGQRLGVGQRLPMGYDVYNVPLAYRGMYNDSDDMWYRYDDGTIYGVDPRSRMIRSMHSMSYGGYMVGQPVPSYASYGGYTGFGYGGYPSYSASAYDQLYYSQPGYNYQFANNGIYQVDPLTQIVSALVALVTGANFGVGQPLPMGYDVYNVPSAYRASYYDTPDSWYRYNDGYIYQVDPASRLIQAQIPLSYDPYRVGYPVPAAYPGYAVPAQYDALYHSAPGYDYRYFDGGIYAIDPDTQMVQSQVALLTGQTFGVGQMLPVGYDAYNVPMAYRSRYYDTPNAAYRYGDGRIYQVDPTTRLIQAVIDAIA